MQRSGLKPPTSRIAKPPGSGLPQVTSGLPKPGATPPGTRKLSRGVQPSGSLQNLASSRPTSAVATTVRPSSQMQASTVTTANGVKGTPAAPRTRAHEGSKPAPAAPTASSAPPVSEFTVGVRVIVGDSKPGVIAFLGTTQFAKGDWAGVILDAPVGKNDGSVQAVRYFKCEPNHGVFARPEKLKRLAPSAAQEGPRLQPQQTIPPEQRAAALAAKRQQLRIGDRVIIGGAKEGTLRFLGKTEFANGLWAGVELDEAVGKNNGSVAGKRYFQCPPQCGLFAPLTKVEKVGRPIPTTRGDPKRLSLTRSHATEETASITSAGSAARRAGVPLRYTESASPVGSMTSSMSVPLSPANSQIGQVLHEAEQRIITLQAQLEGSAREKEALEREVTELKRQVEDLQFQVVEGNVTGDEVQVASDVDRACLDEIQLENSQLKQRLQELEKWSELGAGHSTELETRLNASQRQVKRLEDDLAEQKSMLMSESSRAKDLQRQLVEKSSSAGEVSSTLRVLQEQLGEMEGRVEALKTDKAALSHELAAKEGTVGRLQRLNEELKSRSEEEKDFLARQKEEEVGWVKERLAQLETELNGKNREVMDSADKLARMNEDMREVISSKQGLQQKVTELSSQLESHDKELGTARTEVQVAEGEVAELRRRLHTEEDRMHILTEEKAQLEGQLRELTRLSGDSSEQMSYLNEQLREKDREIEELHTTVTTLTEEVSRSKDNLERSQGSSSQEVARLREGQEKERREYLIQLEALASELEEQKSLSQSERKRLEEEKASSEAASRAKIRELEDMGHQLRLEVESSASQLSNLRADKDEAENRAELLESELKGTKAALRDLQVDQSAVRQQMREATEAWKTAEDQVRSSQHSQEMLQLEMDTLRKEKSIISKELERAESEKAEINSERIAAITEKEAILKERNSASAEHSSLMEERRRLQLERERLVGEKRVAQAECDTLAAERDEVMERLSREQLARQEAVIQAQEMRLTYDSLKTELEEASSRSNRLLSQVESLEEAAKEKEETSRGQQSRLQGRVAELERLLLSAESDRASCQREALHATEVLDTMRSTNEELENALLSAQTEVGQLQSQVQDQQERIRSLESGKESDVTIWKKRAEAAEKSLINKEREILDAREVAKHLEEEMIVRQSEYEQQIQNVELLEEDKATLELRVAELMVEMEVAQKAPKTKSRENSPRVHKKGVNGDDTRLVEAQEALLKRQVENEDLKQQIEFLNSVISDLQRKLEAAEVLALGFNSEDGLDRSVEGDHSMSSSPMLRGRPPPRLFCDICDVFDQHDTDDCPLQAGELDELAMHSAYHEDRQAERPYCDTCEAFGHWSEECPYDATY